MPDARAKRRRRRRQEQLEAADLEMVSGFAVETHMVAGASIGSVAALVLAYMLWPELDFTHFKRRKRERLQLNGTG